MSAHEQLVTEKIEQALATRHPTNSAGLKPGWEKEVWDKIDRHSHRRRLLIIIGISLTISVSLGVTLLLL